MILLEFQTLFVYVISSGVFLGFIIGLLVSIFGRR